MREVHPPGLCRKVRYLSAGLLFSRRRVVNYSKPPLSFDLQAVLLVARGLEGALQGVSGDPARGDGIP